METELKLLLSPAELARMRRDPLVRALQRGRAHTRQVHSVYYDTPELALARAGIALRLRVLGGRWVQTLKTRGAATAGLHMREEWEWPLPGAALDFGLLATTPAAKHFRSRKLRATLRPMFATTFKRVSLNLGFADGSVAELCLDSGEIRSGRRRTPICEAEIELLSGSPLRLFELALQLNERLSLRLGQQSKAERGYALASGSPSRPVKAAAAPLDAQASVATAFALIATGCVAHLQANEAGFLQGRDPEYLHQVRVALRRLRACFSLFAPALTAPAFAAIASELRERGTLLGRARDWDVFVHEMLRALRGQREGEAAVAAFVRRCARIGRAHVHSAQALVATPAWSRLWLELGRLLVDGGWMQGEPALAQPVMEFAAASLEARADRLRKRGRELDALDAEGRHRLRIAAKKLRYACEFFASLYPRHRVQAYVGALSALQDVLGSLNDAATQLGLLQEVVSQLRAPDARIAGMIEGWSAASTHLQLDQLQRAWARWKQQKPYWISTRTHSR